MQLVEGEGRMEHAAVGLDAGVLRAENGEPCCPNGRVLCHVGGSVAGSGVSVGYFLEAFLASVWLG
jgi:hypothetical protein